MSTKNERVPQVLFANKIPQSEILEILEYAEIYNFKRRQTTYNYVFLNTMAEFNRLKTYLLLEMYQVEMFPIKLSWDSWEVLHVSKGNGV